MAREYYPCWIRVDGRDLYLIWFSNDRDGIYAEDDGVIPSFSSLPALRVFSEERDLQLCDGVLAIHDFDAVRHWIANDDPARTDPELVLGAWNLLADSAGKHPVELFKDHHLYMKIVTANNLPIFTPPGEAYHPTFTRAELAGLKRTLARHLKAFTRRLAASK